MKPNIIGAINDRSYGIVCKELTLALSKLTDLTLWPLYLEQNSGVEHLLKGQDSYEDEISIRIWHQFDLAQHVGRYRIGFPIFELDQFTSREKNHLAKQDHIFVCSNWAKRVVEPHVRCPVDVIPLGVNDRFSPAKYTNDKFRFMNVGKWEIRKGHDFLIQAFKRAFTNEPVELYMCCHNPFLSPYEEMNWHRIYDDPRVTIVPWLRQPDLIDLMNRADCAIFPSRAEGWNLEASEFLALGKPIIATNYSGHTEFLNKNNSFLIEVSEIEPAFDGKWFFGQGNWAKLGADQMDQTIELMRYVYNNRPHVEPYRLTWEDSASKVYAIIQGISGSSTTYDEAV